MSGPILALPENDETYILYTDASDTEVGAVLSQLQTEVKKVIAYVSRTMSVANAIGTFLPPEADRGQQEPRT